MINKRKIRMGMVGGGDGAFIGAIHRMAAALDGEIELVCGAFSSNAQRSVNSGLALNIAKSRCYETYQQMFANEQTLADEVRMDFVVIVTPNHLHFPIAKFALESGFHVLSDKPATIDLAQALMLQKIIEESGRLYGLTHTYNGYPLIKQAKYFVDQGQLGVIRKVVVEYSQSWLSNKDDESGKQAKWRLDPQQSGKSCCMGDIGVHAANLAEYVTGLSISQLCADLNTSVDERQLDDDGTILLRFNSGARGVLLASQISVGEENNLRLRVYGDTASLDWSQQEPNSMWLKYNDKSSQLIRTGVGEFCTEARNAIRTPAGHPEGYIEAFANFYKNFSGLVRAYEHDESVNYRHFDIAGIDEAIRGMAFIENVVSASQSETKWHDLKISESESELKIGVGN